MKLRTRSIRNYAYPAGGRSWVVPVVHLTELPDGRLGLSMAEGERVHRGIAHAVCTGPTPLTLDELEFLLDLARVTSVELAEHLGVHKSALSKWRSRGSIPSGIINTSLKRYFWFQLFSPRIAKLKAPLSAMASDEAVLAYVRAHAEPEDLGASAVRAA